MNNLFESDKVYSVLELNTVVKGLIQKQFPAAVWISGEIQGLRPDRDKAHTYFELVQKDPHASSVMARVKVALFANRKPFIQRRIDETKGAFELKNDTEVKFLCEVSLHPPTGQYSIIVIDVDPIYTLGKLAQNRQLIIEDLRKRNLIERNGLLPFPAVPLRIGLITAFDSAAYHDFTHELSLSGFGFNVSAYNCHMQGKNVQYDVLSALNFFNENFEAYDLIIITRGGGSSSDLSWFDNKSIAEAIAFSKLPVLAALGHQIDMTVCDIVAHTSLKTPTKGAQRIIEGVTSFLNELNTLGENICIRSQDLLSEQRQLLGTAAMSIESKVVDYFEVHKANLLTNRLNMIHSVQTLLTGEKQNSKVFFERLRETLNNIFKNLNHTIEYNDSKIRILDPREILKRGFSITRKADSALKSMHDIDKGDVIETIFFDGKIKSRVEDVYE